MTCNEMAFFPPNFMLQQSTHEDNHHHPNQQVFPLDHFHGVASLLGKRSMSFSGVVDMCHEETNGEDDMSDDGSNMGEKKRRLTMEQVKTLEKNFELANKLEPERKMHLARALGLQPRQIAIWFQNRRARWKTKQLEKDYDILKRKFDAMKADNDALQAQNKKLHSEIMALRNREEHREPSDQMINLNKETEGSSSNRSENSSEINLDLSRTSPNGSPPISRQLFTTSIMPSSVVQLLQSSSKPDQHCQKIEPSSVHHEEGGFCNMFIGIDDQPNFWPWPEHQQQFH